MSNEPDSRQSQPPADDEPVPRLPRGRGIRLSFAEIMRILMILAMLISVLALRRPCAENTGRFIQSFEPPVDAGPARTPGQLPPGQYIPLSGEMTEEELRQKLELHTPRDAGPATITPPGPGPDSVPSPAPGDSVPSSAPGDSAPGSAPGASVPSSAPGDSVPSSAPDSAPNSATAPATGAGPAQPSEDTSHDREPRDVPDRKPSRPAPR